MVCFVIINYFIKIETSFENFVKMKDFIIVELFNNYYYFERN